MRDRIVLVVHAHLYQPPRENPWTDAFENDASAAPFANWNERIDAECYRANAYARIYDGRNRVSAMANNFAVLSFNVGPTLARWLERHDAQVMRRIKAGNEEQRRRVSAGGALAQVWAHPIAPLLSARDLRSQIAWGIHDFRRLYGYPPRGMWLPETAANEATLAALIDAGVAFTILAPEQIQAVRAPGGSWQEVTPASLDTGRAYSFFHPDGSGRQIALAVFDGPLSRDLAFGPATRDANGLLTAVERSAARSRVSGPRLVLAASDGELYGHHKKFADLTLAYTLGVAAPRHGIQVTNLEAFLAESPPTWEARLQPGHDRLGTAWSCSHGLGRWLRDCGCRMNGARSKSQAWRAPLRQALDLLRDKAADFFAQQASEQVADPWRVRDDYGAVVEESADARLRFLRGVRKEGAVGDDARLLLLLEMQRSLLLMYTSCAWFFDDVAGPESAIALARAGHAMDLWRRLGGEPPEQEMLARLAGARSNDARLGTGADAFARAARRRVTCEQVVGRAALSRLLRPAASVSVPGFELRSDRLASCDGDSTLVGQAEVIESRTGLAESHAFRVSCESDGGILCEIDGRAVSPATLDAGLDAQLRLRALAWLANQPMSEERMRTLLDHATGLSASSDAQGAVVAASLMRALNRYLDAACLHDGGEAEGDWSVALRLAERALPHATWYQLLRAQDLVWERLDSLRRRHAAVPGPLQALAERIDGTRRNLETASRAH